MRLPNAIRWLVSTEYMVKPHMRQGDIPPTKEAYRQSIKMAGPAVAEMVSIAIMGMMDMIMVSQIGPHAVTAVGLTGQPRMIFFSVFFALNIAVTAIVARNKGAGDDAAALSCLRQAMMIVLLGGGLFSGTAIMLARPMMQLAGAQPDTIDLSASYFRISSFGIVFAIMSGTICAAQRASGNTKITMQVNIVANIAKVIFNFLLIEGRFGFPRLEVDGAAVSLVIANVISFSLAFASLHKKDAYLRIRRKDNWRFELPMLKVIGRVASGSMLEQVALRVGFFFSALVIAMLGTHEAAAHFIAQQLLMISFAFADGLGVATTALVGQNLGRARPDLSIMFGKIGTRLAWMVSAVLCVIVFFSRFRFPLLFALGNDPEIVQMTAGVILILVYMMPFQTAQIVMAGSLRGAGDTRFVAMTMMVSVTLLRPVLSFTLVYPLGLGLTGAWIAMSIDQIVRLVMLLKRFSGGRWVLARL